MTKARTLADMISDGVIGTTELADDVITPVKLDETGSYVVSGLTANGGSGAVTLAANSDIRATSGNWTGEHSGKIQYHNNQWYLQFADDLIARNGSAVNVFKVDSTGSGYFASNVAIGITSASKKLSVHASTAYDGALISNAHSSSAARLQLSNDDSKSLQVDMGGSTQPSYGPFGANIAAVVSASAPLNIGTDSANHVAFYTNLTERMFISSSGSVGINNNSPTESLHIKGTNPRIYVEGDSNSYYPSIRVDGVNGGISLGTYYGGNISGENSLTFLTGDSATDGGSPRLQIRGDNDIEIRNLQSAAGGVDTNALYWKIQNSANTGQYARLGGIKAETVSAWGGKLKFYTKPANGTPNDTVTEQMVIDQAGRVTTPYQPAVYVRKSNGQNITSAGVWTVISYNDVSQQTGSNYSNQTNRFTAPISGWHHISATLNVTANSSASSFSINAFVNGSSTYIGESNMGTSTRQNLTVSGAKYLNSGDYVEIRFRSQSSTAVLDNSGFMSVYLLG